MRKKLQENYDISKKSHICFFGIGDIQNDYGKKIAIDAKGYIYIVADGYGGIDGNTNSGSGDIYLLKYNSSGVKQ